MGYENPHHLNLVFFQIFWTIQPVSSKKYPACQRCRKKTIIAISAAGRSWIWLFSTEFFLFSHSSPYPHKKKNIATSTQVTIESERILEKQKKNKKKENFMTPFRPPFFVGIKKMVGSFTRGFLIATDYKGKKKLSWTE